MTGTAIGSENERRGQGAWSMKAWRKAATRVADSDNDGVADKVERDLVKFVSGKGSRKLPEHIRNRRGKHEKHEG